MTFGLRRLGIIFVVAVALSCAGCGADQSSDTRLAGWVSSPFESDAMQQIVTRFNEERVPGSLTYQPIQANYIEKIQLMLGTGTAPDVFMLESFWAPTLIEYETLLPLDDLIAADERFDLEDFEPSLLEAFQHDGQTFGIPKDFSTIALFYNPEMFAAVGIARPPESWSELLDAAERLSQDIDGDGITDVYGFGAVDSIEFVLPFIWQNGGELLTADGGIDYQNQKAKEAIQFLKTMRDDSIAAVPTDLGASWNMEAFGRGRIAMTISGLWAVNFLETTFPDMPYEIVPIPSGVRQQSIAYVVGYVIPRNTRDPAKAWEVLRYLTSKQGQQEWASLDLGLPPRKSVVAATGLVDDPQRAVFIDAASYARTWQLGPNQRLMDELQTAIQAIFLTDAPIEDALKRADERL